MQYRDFGKTGFKISALGFGAMRLPIPENQDKNAKEDLGEAVDLLRYGFEKGINYVDTAYMYCGGRSETAVGLALEGERRNRVLLSTKLPLWNFEKREDFRRILEEQLRKLRTDHVDFYHFHALGRERLEDKILPLGLLDEAEKLKGEGLFRHLAFSFHDPDPEVMKKIIKQPMLRWKEWKKRDRKCRD